MPRIPHALLVAGLLSLSAGAIAQPPGPPNGGPDARTPMTRDALKSMVEARFDKLDANHDGTLDAQDPQARRAERRALVFDRIDANKDGAISKDEFDAISRRGDRPMHARRAMMFDRAGPDGPRALHGPIPFEPMAGRDGAPRSAITKSAFVEQRLALFDKVDTNHDGTISAAERDTARGIMRDRRGRAELPLPSTATP